MQKIQTLHIGFHTSSSDVILFQGQTRVICRVKKDVESILPINQRIVVKLCLLLSDVIILAYKLVHSRAYFTEGEVDVFNHVFIARLQKPLPQVEGVEVYKALLTKHTSVLYVVAELVFCYEILHHHSYEACVKYPLSSHVRKRRIKGIEEVLHTPESVRIITLLLHPDDNLLCKQGKGVG